MKNRPTDSDKQTESIEKLRNQIAQDMHDSLAQTLASLQLRFEVLEKNLHEQKADKILLANMRKIKQDIQQANKEIRSLIKKFRSPAIQNFRTSIENLATNFRYEQPDIYLYMQYHCPPLPFDTTIKTNIYRIIQESLSNIKKHSKAKFVRMMFTCETSQFRMLIEDDGIGFLPHKIDNNRHFGLSVMAERAREISAQFNCESTFDDGCRICLSLTYKT